MAYIKYIYYYLIYLIEKFVLHKKNLKIPVMIMLSKNIMDYIYMESHNRKISINDFVILILKDVIDEYENK